MKRKPETSQSLAAKITRASSKQTYYTIRFLVDGERVPDAYRAYAYFRWLDDILDAEAGAKPERLAFIRRQQALLDACYRGEAVNQISPQERMLVDLVRNNGDRNSGLGIYLRSMMAVMAFDVERRGGEITQSELSDYSRLLATAVTEAIHYFIGYGSASPGDERRYLAVWGAHIVHMLRDAIQDAEVGYVNIPAEYIQAHGVSVQNTDEDAYRKWVYERADLARSYFRKGKEYFAQVESLRCRLAGLAYTARFEWMLEAIERDGYRLRRAYPKRKSFRAGLWMAWRTLSTLSDLLKPPAEPGELAFQLMRYEE